jgi:hypothetical protein
MNRLISASHIAEDTMSERNDTETQSYREEQGKSGMPDQRDRIADVPVVPSSAGVVRGAAPEGESTVDTDRNEAAEREHAEHREVF